MRGILVSEALERGVMSGRRLAVEEPGLSHPEGAGTHRHDQRVLLVDFPEPGTQLVISRLGPTTTTSGAGASAKP